MLIDHSHRTGLRHTLVVLALMAAGIVAVWLVPANVMPSFGTDYLPLHVLLETVGVVVASLVFAVGWNSRDDNLPGNVALLGAAFLAVAMLDLAHTLSYDQMPAFVTPSGPEKAIDFWLVARLVAAGTLLVATLRPWRPFTRPVSRWASLVGYLALVAATASVVLTHPEWLPRTYVDGVGLTPFKVGVEYLVVAICLVAAVVLGWRMRDPLPYNAPALFGAVCAMAMGELLFTRYTDVTDGTNLVAHVYKAVSFVFIYLAIVVTTVERPYRELRTSQRTLQATLAALPDLLLEVDEDGRVVDVRGAGAALLALPPGKAVGLRVEDLLDAPAARAVRSALAEARDTGCSRGRQYLLTTSEGPRWHELSVAPRATEADERARYVVLSHDVDASRRTEADLAASRNLLQTIIDTAPLRIFWKDRELRYLGCNPAFAHDAGLSAPDEVVGKDDHELGRGELGESYRADDRHVLATGLPLLSYDEPQSGPDGSTRWLRTSKVALRDPSGTTSGVLGIYDDITERKQAEVALQRSQAALTTAQAIARVGSWEYDATTGRLDASAEARRMFGLGPTVELDLDLVMGSVHPEDRDLMLLAVRSGEPVDHEFRVVVDSEIRWVRARLRFEADSPVDSRRVVGTTQDVSDRKLFEDRVYALAHFDTLTGLANRAQLEDRLLYAISAARRDRGRVALMFIDLDRFKDVNDTLGHSVGDALLVELARRLRGALREEDVVCRLGGDEFIVMAPGTGARGADHVARQLLDVIARPYRIEEYDLSLTASIGVAVYPSDGGRREELLRSADTAMYRAKQDGRNCIRFFTPAMQERSARNLQLVNDLRHAAAKGQLSVVYQPQVALDDGRLVGVEALLRWQHPELGAVPPGEFIPIAEESGLILPIGEWVLRRAVRQARAWLDEGLAPMVTAVNLSAVQLRRTDLAGTVDRILDEEGLDARHLELELTEGVATHDPQIAVTVLNELHERGVRLSLDDFGTGYSAIGYLKAFNVYKLKIDQSFVRDIELDADDRTIVGTIITIAKNLGLRTIAEGVETAGQLDYLRTQGCDEVQGYYYSRPLTPQALSAFARQHAPRRRAEDRPS